MAINKSNVYRKVILLLFTVLTVFGLVCIIAGQATADTETNSKATEATASSIPDGGEDSQADALAQEAGNTVSEENLAWAQDTDCTSCHPKEVERMTNEKCLTSVHPSLDCIDCHTQFDVLAPMHEGVNEEDEMPASLYSTDIDTDLVCSPCHDIENLVILTENSTFLTDDNGTVVNPHDLPAIADHKDITCVSCHKMHSTTSLEKTSSRACTACHHANVYECNTCHTV